MATHAETVEHNHRAEHKPTITHNSGSDHDLIAPDADHREASAVTTATSQSGEDPIPQSVREILDLYRTHAELRFPDMDGEVLASMGAQVRESAAEVERARCVLDAARQTHAAHQAELLAGAKRAFAYARVYAEADEALGEALAGFQLSGATKAPAVKRRRKGNKGTKTYDPAAEEGGQDQVNELPFESASPSPAFG